MPNCANCPNCLIEPADQAPGLRWTAPRRKSLLSGILNVDKPSGMTSHDVVDVVRRISGQRRVGHAGTLDPMATGVLLLCLGQATRLAEYLMAGRKRYRAMVILGISTDTYDAEGRVVSAGTRTIYERGEIEAVLGSFLGCVEQVPPIYSALKRAGEPFYKLARRGEKVEPLPRQVEIDEILLQDWTSPALVIEVVCSPGTYIRSLAHDLGTRLDSAAHLASLVRLSSGRFALENAVSLERLEEAFRHGEEKEYLLPLDEALLDWPAMVLEADKARRISNGQAIVGDPPATEGAWTSREGHSLCRAYSLEGDFLAVLAYEPKTGLWTPKKVFAI